MKRIEEDLNIDYVLPSTVVEIETEGGISEKYNIFVGPPNKEDKNKDLAFGYAPVDNPNDITLLEIIPEKIEHETVDSLRDLPLYNPEFVKNLISTGNNLKRYAEGIYKEDPKKLKLTDLQTKITRINTENSTSIRYIVTLKPNIPIDEVNLYQEYLKRLERRII